MLPWKLLVPTINTPRPGHFRDIPGSEVKEGESWKSRSHISAGCLQVVEVGTADTQEGNVGVPCLLGATYCPQPHKHQTPPLPLTYMHNPLLLSPFPEGFHSL